MEVNHGQQDHRFRKGDRGDRHRSCHSCGIRPKLNLETTMLEELLKMATEPAWIVIVGGVILWIISDIVMRRRGLL
jgi:hypothetical protein